MSKYIIEIEDEPFGRNDDPNIPHGMDVLYKAKGFNSLVFDQFGLDKLIPLDKALEEAYQKGIHDGSLDVKQRVDGAYQKGYEVGQHEATTLEYQQGLNDAWEAITKIAKMPDGERGKAFGDTWLSNILNKYSVSEIINILDGYESEQDEIKVGDQVRNTLGLMDNAVGYFFGDSSDGCYKVLRYVDGKFKTGIWNKENCERTGKHSYAVERMVAVTEEGAE